MFYPESPFRKPTRTSENTKQEFPLFSFLAIMTLGCVHVLYPPGRMESPEYVNMIFILGGKISNPTRGKHVLKRAERHRCEENTLWKFACNFGTFL